MGTPSATDDRNAWHEFNDVNEFDEVLQASILDGWDDDPREARLSMNYGLDREDQYSEKYYLPDGRDYFQEGRGHFGGVPCGATENMFCPLPGLWA